VTRRLSRSARYRVKSSDGLLNKNRRRSLKTVLTADILSEIIHQLPMILMEALLVISGVCRPVGESVLMPTEPLTHWNNTTSFVFRQMEDVFAVYCCQPLEPHDKWGEADDIGRKSCDRLCVRDAREGRLKSGRVIRLFGTSKLPHCRVDVIWKTGRESRRSVLL
jgi:hypothetical protein